MYSKYIIQMCMYRLLFWALFSIFPFIYVCNVQAETINFMCNGKMHEFGTNNNIYFEIKDNPFYESYIIALNEDNNGSVNNVYYRGGPYGDVLFQNFEFENDKSTINTKILFNNKELKISHYISTLYGEKYTFTHKSQLDFHASIININETRDSENLNSGLHSYLNFSGKCEKIK